MATQNDTDTSKPVTATQGGTSTATYAAGDTLYASATNTLSKLAAGTNGHIYTVSSGIPAWSALLTGTVAPGSEPIYTSAGTWAVNDAVKYTIYEDDMTVGGPTWGSVIWPWENTTSGAGAAAQPALGLDNHPGLVYVSTGTTTTGRGVINKGNVFQTGADFIRYESLIMFPDLATVAQDYWSVFGLSEMTASDITPTTGIYLEYRRSNSTNWRGCCTSGGSTTRTTGTDVAVSEDVWHYLVFEVNTAASSVTFYVDGTNIGSVTANIPSNPTYINMMIVKTAGSTARVAYMDYVKYYSEFGSDRG